MCSGRSRAPSPAISFAVLMAFFWLNSGSPARAASDPDPTTQSTADPCGAEVYLEAQLARDPELAARREQFEAMLREAVKNGLVPRSVTRPSSTSANPIYTIPVVVHIVHSGVGADLENISDGQVLGQIAAINRDGQNLPNNLLPAVDCQLRFCLASNFPSGSTGTWPGTQGITRTLNASAAVVQFGNAASDAALKAIDYFPSNQYLNVWVVKQIAGGSGGIVGYATFPGSVPATLDGIVMDYRVMGANNTGYGTFPVLLPTYDEGKVFAHEVGHWLNLYHTFHNGCTPGDLVADTPPEAVNNWGCPSSAPTSCGNSGDPIQNFMDYTNDPCRFAFTDGQRIRMQAAITTYRSQLVSPANLVATGACPPLLFAVITLNPSQVCVNDPVQCSAPSCGSCTYAWTFQGGTGSTSGQVTTATFGSPGPHTVTLTMTDGANTSSATAVVYVTACTPISGPCTNWVWGNRCRLNFASGMPVAVSGTKNLGPECGTQISDNSGNLLFYTDNDTVRSVNNAPMPNGGGIIGGRSSHTGALILPKPGSPTKYFLFSIRQWEDGAQSDPLHVTTVDMNLNFGFGDVVLAEKNVNIPLPGTPKRLLEGMTLIPHCNGTDWWLITHGADSTNSNYDWSKYLYVTLITSTGAGPSLSYPIGMGGTGVNYTAWGTVTASKDGTKIAVCRANNAAQGDVSGGAIRIYNFDRATGLPTLALNTGNIDANQDVAFSPNGKIIYYCYLMPGTQAFYGLRQMKLATQEVRTLTTPVVPGGDLDVELGPDGKIYVAHDSQNALHCVNFPDSLNTFNLNECGFNPLSIPLGAGAIMNANGSLPNTLPICSASAAPAQFTYSITHCDTVTFQSPNCGPWNWTFGDNGTGTGQTVTHAYSGTGTYQVTLTAPSAFPSTLTIPVTIGAVAVTISGPNTTCGGPSNYSVTGPANYTYTWTITGGTPTSATGNNVFVSWGLTAGAVQVTATDPATGCKSTASLGLEACAICAKPPLDLVAWWPLDETSGVLAQDVVAAHDGQDVNAPAKVPGAVSNSRQFNGTSSFIRVNDDPKLNLGTSNLTIDAWINTASGASPQGIVEKRALLPDRGYALYLKQGQLALLLGDGSSGTEFIGTNTANLADGKWHHVAATEDRSDSTTGTKLYVDGSPIAVLPGYSSIADVDNTEKLLIGAQEPSATPTSYFNGKIDEVEIFSRALSGVEVAKIWGAGPAGKCKEFSYVPSSQTICNGQNFVLVTMQLCNLGTSPQTFNLSFAGISGAGCNGAGPTVFQMLNQNNPVPVPQGSCVAVTLKIDRPSGLNQGDVSCYAVTATNLGNNVAHVSHGSIWANDLLCPHLTSVSLSSVGVSTPASIRFQLSNTSQTGLSIPVLVDAKSSDGEPVGPAGVISLNGLPPGVPWTSNYFLAAGESTLVTVDASFTRPMPFRFFDVVLAADANGDGVTDAESSAGMLYSEPPPQLLGVPRTAPAAKLALLGATPNPFRRTMSVEFELPHAGRMRLALYDVSGRRVRNLVDGLSEAGRGVRTVSAAGLPSGVYFLRLEMEGKVRTKPVVLLRE